MKKTHGMELLAPVGGFAAFEAAFEHGADAVYVGAPRFNARAPAKELSLADIGAMIERMHTAGKKLYVAMNSLIKETEIADVLSVLTVLAKLRPDALIIQDLGLFHLCRNYFPELVLHASTLMSVHNSLAAERLTALGFERVVLARELTMKEIVAVSKNSAAELEVFVHGAMCFSYSGLCLFSTMHGGKSSLRGQCVQPCRRRYSWQRGKGGANSGTGYPFSMNDLCAIDLLPELRRAGVASLKIEGRLKNAQYVGKTVAAYRLILDALDAPPAERREIVQRAHGLLDESMGRKRSSGYFLDARPDQAVTPAVSGSGGLPVGKVSRLRRTRDKQGGERLVLFVSLQNPLTVGDRLRLHDHISGERIAFTARALVINGRSVQQAKQGSKVEIPLPLGKFKKIPDSNIQGDLFKIDVRDRRSLERSAGRRRDKARPVKVAPDQHRIQAILADFQPAGGQVSQKGARPGRERGKKRHPGRRQHGGAAWWARVRSPRDVGVQLPIRPAKYIVPLTRENVARAGMGRGKKRRKPTPMVWSLPPIILEKELPGFRRDVEQLLEAGFREFQLGHFTQLGLFAGKKDRRPAGDPHLYGDYTLNILNSAALRAAGQAGFSAVQFSVETDAEALAAALRDFGGKKPSLQVGLMVYGRPPLFSSRLVGQHLAKGTEFTSPMGERFQLDNKSGMTEVRSVRPFSLMQWLGEPRAMGVDYFVIDLTGGPLKKESAIFAQLLNKPGGKVLSGNFHGNLI